MYDCYCYEFYSVKVQSLGQVFRERNSHAIACHVNDEDEPATSLPLKVPGLAPAGPVVPLLPARGATGSKSVWSCGTRRKAGKRRDKVRPGSAKALLSGDWDILSKIWYFQ